MKKSPSYHFFESNRKAIIDKLGPDRLVENLRRIYLIRNFELRAEAAYQQGRIGGFFHAYVGQEAIQTGAVEALGLKNWYTTSYRCHALALLLGASLEEVMAELFGRATGNAKGRGGSMHLYTDRLLGGYGIVTGQVPIATGAGFSIKYKEIKNEVSICFMGDGAVPQGAFHESLNLASLWDLPCIYVIENNKWSMGTSVERGVCVQRLAEDKAPGYNMKGYTFDGTDFFNCYAGFDHLYHEVLATKRPVLVEAIAERFKGHSISDPGVYRTKEQLKEAMQSDPLVQMQDALIEADVLTHEQAKLIDKETRNQIATAIEFAEKSPWPDPILLGEDVFAPNQRASL